MNERSWTFVLTVIGGLLVAVIMIYLGPFLISRVPPPNALHEQNGNPATETVADRQFPGVPTADKQADTRPPLSGQATGTPDASSVILNPEDFMVIGTPASVRYGWEAYPGADTYRVTVYDHGSDDTAPAVLMDYLDSGLSVNIPAEVQKPGHEYVVDVETGSTALNTSTTILRAHFAVGYYSHPYVRPVKDCRITKEQASSGLRITWTAVPGAAKYRLRLIHQSYYSDDPEDFIDVGSQTSFVIAASHFLNREGISVDVTAVMADGTTVTGGTTDFMVESGCPA